MKNPRGTCLCPPYDDQQIKYSHDEKSNFVIGKHPCGVCRKGVGDNSIRSVECLRWIHKRCSGISGKLKSNVDFHCRRCLQWRRHGGMGGSGPPTSVQTPPEIRANPLRSVLYIGGGVSHACIL